MSLNNIVHIKLYPALILMITFFVLFSSPNLFAQFKIETVKPAVQSFFEEDKGETKFTPIFRYNRVEGAALGVNASIMLKKLQDVELLGRFSYGLEDTYRYKAGIQKSFFEFNPLTIGVAYQDQVASLDDWYIGEIENSVAALLFKEDFMDYFGKKGISAFIDQKVGEVHTLRFEIDNMEYESLQRETNWALLYKNHDFRKNPSVVEESTTALRLMWVLDWRDNPLIPMEGWYIEGKVEKTLGDSVDTDGLFLTLKRYKLLFGNHLLKLKFMLGTRAGCTPNYNQYLMDMGGIGSLIGYKDKEFKNGNRFFYATFRYLFNDTVMGKLPLDFIPFYDQLSLGLFAETGWLDFVNPDKNIVSGFDGLTANNLKSDVGLTLYVTEGLAQFDFSRRTDRSKDAWRVTFRVMHKF